MNIEKIRDILADAIKEIHSLLSTETTPDADLELRKRVFAVVTEMTSVHSELRKIATHESKA